MQKREALVLWKELNLPGEPVAVGEGLFALVVEIGPDLAQEILEKYNMGNRNKKWRSIDRYVGDMNNGRWRLTHEALAFTDWKKLLDGQNRLEAIVRSGKSIKLLAVIGLAESVATFINEGSIRTSLDAAMIANLDTTQGRLAVAKNIARGYDRLSEPMSNPHTLDILQEFEEILDWLKVNVPRAKGVTTSGTLLGAIGRCYLYVRSNTKKVGVLKKFCQVLEDGQWKDLDDPIFENAARLRDKMLGGRYWGKARPLYALVEYVLAKTLSGHVLARLPNDAKLKSFAHEWFPLPEEEDKELSED